MKTFGERVREARKAKGYSLDQVSKAMRSHKGYICGIETGGTSAPSPKMLPALCRKLELSLEEMAALAYWEKRPKLVTAGALLKLLEEVITDQQMTEPKKSQEPPAAADPQKEAV